MSLSMPTNKSVTISVHSKGFDEIPNQITNDTLNQDHILGSSTQYILDKNKDQQQ